MGMGGWRGGCVCVRARVQGVGGNGGVAPPQGGWCRRSTQHVLCQTLNVVTIVANVYVFRVK